MKCKWTCNQVQSVPTEMDQTEYEQRIAEIWEILYGEFCQLQKKSRPIGPEPTVSPENALIERNGTNG